MSAEPAEPPRWLSSDELESWLPLGGLLLRLPAALDAQMQRDSQLSHFEYLVLANLSEAPERTRRMSALAALANGSLSRLSHVVKRLEGRGWVERRACPQDGRYTNAVLTEAGWEKVLASAPGHVTAVRALVLDALSPDELVQLGDMARRILGRLDPADCGGAAGTGKELGGPGRTAGGPGREAGGSGREAGRAGPGADGPGPGADGPGREAGGTGEQPCPS